MYDGEVFTVRNERPARQSMARPQRTPPPDLGRAEVLAAAERMARLEATVRRLEESLSHLTGVVEQLSEALAEAETVRAKSVAEPPAPAAAEPAPPPQQPAPLAEVESAPAPKVSVQMIRQERPAQPPVSDVKVSLFGSSSTEAILGQVKVTHND